MRARWQSHMHFMGTTRTQALTCRTCVGGCALLPHLQLNRFTVHRRHADWYDVQERYRPGPQAQPNRFIRELTDARDDRRYARRAARRARGAETP